MQKDSFKGSFIVALLVLLELERVVGLAGLPGDITAWLASFRTIQDFWSRMIPDFWSGALIGALGMLVLVLAWNAWRGDAERFVRKRLELRDGHALWYGLRWRYHWWRIERADDRKWKGKR